MIRTLACFFGLNRAVSGFGEAARHSHAADKQLHSDALGEFLLGSNCAEVMPEVLLQIL